MYAATILSVSLKIKCSDSGFETKNGRFETGKDLRK